MKLKRPISLMLLAIVLASTTLPSCGGESDVQESGTTDTTQQTVETNALTGSGLEVRDWGGKTFNVMTSKPGSDGHSFRNFEVYATEENGDIVNDAVYRRNMTLETLLNVNITETPISTELTGDDIRQAVLAGDQMYDLAFARSYEIGKLALEGNLYDMNQLEYVDYTKDWWDKLVIENAEVEGKLFFASSAFDLHAKKRTYMLLYNTDLAAKYQIGNIADLVREGKWTIDKEIEYVKLVSSDLNGDSKMDLDDQYGLVLGDMKDLQYYFVAAGGKIAKKDENGKIQLTMNNDRTIQLIDKYLELSGKNYTVSPNRFGSYDDSYAVFWNGRALFYDGILSSVESASSRATFDYKALPLPKLDEEQSQYYTMMDNIGLLFCVPVNAPDPEFTGYMLEALSYVSDSTTLPTYYEKCCKIKSVYDEDSAEMIDIAMSGQICDIGFLYDIGGLAGILNSQIPSGTKNNFVSLYAAREEKAKQKIADIYEKLNELP